MKTRNWEAAQRLMWFAPDEGVTAYDTSDGSARTCYYNYGQPCSATLFKLSEYSGADIGIKIAAYANGSAGFMFGDGNTEPTENDYRLSGNIVSAYNVAAFSHSLSIDPITGKGTMTCTYTITATGSITIKEWGYFVNMHQSGTSTQYTDRFQFMVFREVLDTPLTLANGETGQVVITVKEL